MVSKREKVAQLGFWDEEVSKPDHDTIVMWAYEHAEDIVRRYLATFPKRDPFDSAKTEWTSAATRIFEPAGYPKRATFPPKPPKPQELIHKRSLERVIEQYPEHGRGLPRILVMTH